MFLAGILLLTYFGDVSRAYDYSEYQKKYAGHDGFYLMVNWVSQHFPENAKSFQYLQTVEQKYIVFNPKNESLSIFRLDLAKERKLSRFGLVVYQPNGDFKKYNIKDLKKIPSQAGATIFKFAIPNLRSGTLVHILYRTEFNEKPQFPLLTDSFPLQFAFPCENLSVTFAYPELWRIQLKEIGPDKLPKIQREHLKNKGSRILTYTAKNVEAIPNEPFSPPFKQISNYMEVTITQIALVGYQLWKAPGWKRLGTSYMDHAQRLEKNSQSALEDKVRRLVGNTDDNREKMKRIIQFVQDKIGTTGAGEANTFKKMFLTGMGNYLDNTILAQAMLSEAGVKSRLLFIHSDKDGYFDPSFHSTNQFTMPALHCPDMGDAAFLFPSLKGVPMNVIPGEYQEQQAYEIRRSGKGRLIKIPSKPQAHRSISNIRITIDDEGNANIEEEITFSISNSWRYRSRLSEMEAEEETRFLENLIGFKPEDAILTNGIIINRTDERSPLQIRLEYELEALIALTPSAAILPTEELFDPLPSNERIDLAQRRTPIYLSEPFESHRIIEVNYPTSWNLQNNLEGITFRNWLGSTESQYTNEPGRLIATRKLNLIKASAPPKSFPDLVALSEAATKSPLTKLIFSLVEDPEVQ